MEKILSQVPYNIPGRITGLGEFADPGGQAPSNFVRIVSVVIGLMTLIAGVFFFFILLSGAIGWISAGGDRQKIESARQRIFNGVIGIVVVVAAIFIVRITGGVIGFPDILNPESTISRLYPGGGGGPNWLPCSGSQISCHEVCGYNQCVDAGCTGTYCPYDPSGTVFVGSSGNDCRQACMLMWDFNCQFYRENRGEQVYCCCN